MPLKHRRCFCSGQRSQQHHPLPSKGWGQWGWGLPPRVCSIPLCPQNTGNCTQIVCSWKKKIIKISAQPAAQSFFLSGTEHLNSAENPNSTKLLSHVDSLMADKGLSPCCTLAASTGGSIPASLPPHHILGRVHPSSCRSFVFPSPVVPGDGGDAAPGAPGEAPAPWPAGGKGHAGGFALVPAQPA